MTEPLKVVPIAERVSKQAVVGDLEFLLERAKKGEVIGVVYAVEESGGTLGWGKRNMTYPFALGLLARVAHHIQKEWDALQ